MSNLEHLIENGLSALKRGVSYEKWLKTMKDDVNWQGNENISIEQLWAICQYIIYTWMPSAQPEERTEMHACDCIYRQAAIDMIMGQPPEAHYPSWYAEQIKALPSAQPEIIHCDDCVHYTGKNHPWGVCLIHRGVVTNRHRVCQGIDYCSWAERKEE